MNSESGFNDLPNEIEGFSKRIFDFPNICVIQYSKSLSVNRFTLPKGQDPMDDILYEVFSDNIDDAIKQMKTKLELIEIFKSDNKDIGWFVKVGMTFEGENKISLKPLNVFTSFDYESNVKKVSIISINADAEFNLFLDIYMEVVSNKGLSDGGIEFGMSNGDLFNNKQAPFNNTLQVYTNKIKEETKNYLNKTFRENSLRLRIFDDKYREHMLETSPYQVFISHDYRDKDIARPLAEELTKLNIKVWYDEYELTYGDSILDKMNQGITKCDYGIIILSKNLLENKRAAKYEFKSFMLRSFNSDDKVIIPIWHNIDSSDLLETMPGLLDKYAANSSDGVKEIARNIKALIIKSL